MKILYGISLTDSIDVTNICLSKLTRNNFIIIPSNDCKRANFFTDPFIDIVKKIIIINNDDITEYDIFTQININIKDNTIQTMFQPDIDEKIKNKIWQF